MRRLAAAAVVAACFGGTAYANGRPPLTNGVHFGPNDNHSVYVATTFGFLISHDDGCSYKWVCEQVMGYNGTYDPKYEIATDGTIFATTYTGLRMSRDGGCTWTTATADKPTGDPGNIATVWVDALDIGPTGAVWVGTADAAKPNDVYYSSDNGATFAARGMLSQSIWWKSIKVAPSNAMRVYVTGYQVAGALPDGGQMPPTAHVERTDDEGAHWTDLPLAGVQYGTTPIVYVKAVDPQNPDVLFLMSQSAAPPAGDKLYRSGDGGETWAEVLSSTDPIRDVVILQDGTVSVATLAGGSFNSTDHGMTFSPMNAPPQLECLGQRADGTIFGCGANWQPDYKAIARTPDEQTWTESFRFVELAGPLDCPATSPAAQMCNPMWPALQAQFGSTGPTNPSCAAPAPDGPSVDAAGPKKSSGSGCCSVSNLGAAGGGAAFGLALCTSAFALRRRRR
ncbi:MAG TPA: sialidase family protein [Kofleriaceae bacterium]|jgi:hypothetical protein